MAETTNDKNFGDKLLDLQKALHEKSLKKDAVNPFHNSKYVTLNQLLEMVIPECNKRGLRLHQLVTHVEGQPAMGTSIVDSDGEEIASIMMLMLKSDDPQAQGSAITYARRYQLMAMLGLVGEDDDDGNAATHEANVQAVQRESGDPKPKFTTKSKAPASEAQIKLMMTTLSRKGIANRKDAEKILCGMAEVSKLEEITKASASVMIDWLFRSTAEQLQEKYLSDETITVEEEVNEVT